MRRRYSLAITLMIALASEKASANIVSVSAGFNSNIATVTVLGTVYSGTDAGGYFGSAGADLAGDPFSLIYVFDTSLGSPDRSAGRTGVAGGAIYSVLEPPRNVSQTSPSLGALFSINGNTKYIGGNFQGYLAWGGRVDVNGLALSTFVAASEYLPGVPSPLNATPENTAVFSFFTLNSFPTFGTPLSYTLAPTDDFFIYGSVAFGFGSERILLTDPTAPSPVPVPGPALGAGLPGLLMALAGFIGWRRSRSFLETQSWRR